MTILILDGHTLNPGDNPWSELEALGDLTVHDRTPPSQIVERCKGAQIVLTNKTPLTAETISALPDLRFISVLATGYNVVDVAAAAERGVAVSNVPAYSTASVAQHTFALILELSNQVGLHDSSVRAGDWVKSPDWTYSKKPTMELDGKILGVVGGGRIGQAVGRIGRAFGMEIWMTPSRFRATAPDQGWKEKTVDEIFSGSDIVTLHCPQTPSNVGFVNRELLRCMKSSAILINTARGGLVAEEDLAEALRSGRPAAAAADVLSSEPPRADNPLLSAPNCTITPHIAWGSLAARKRMMTITASNVRGFLRGATPNLVN